jgi:hypothetical protein
VDLHLSGGWRHAHIAKPVHLIIDWCRLEAERNPEPEPLTIRATHRSIKNGTR